MVALQTWRSQRARESIITYRYELTPDTTWYLSMRLHLLWCDASVSNDICYAISVRFIFPTLTYTSHSLYFHIGGGKDFLFSQCWSLNPGPSECWVSVLPLSSILRPRVSLFGWVQTNPSEFTLHCPVHCLAKTGTRNYSCHLKRGLLLKITVCRFQWHSSCGSLWWPKEEEFLPKETDYRPHQSNMSHQPTQQLCYTNQFLHAQRLQQNI